MNTITETFKLSNIYNLNTSSEKICNVKTYLARFKHPMTNTVFVHVIPPPKADEQSPGDVLYCPEVERQ